LEQGVKILERAPLGRFVRHGYCELPAKEAEVFARAGMDERQFEVASHRFIEVTTSQDEKGLFYEAEEGIICRQVFAAVLNFAGSATRTPATEKVAQELLCAWENRDEMVRRKLSITELPGRNKLFLVLLGDGVCELGRKPLQGPLRSEGPDHRERSPGVRRNRAGGTDAGARCSRAGDEGADI
jgi:hypothetical protein